MSDKEPGEWYTPPKDRDISEPSEGDNRQADREKEDKIDRKGWDMGLGSTD